MGKSEIVASLTRFPPSWEELLSSELQEPYFQELVQKVASRYEEGEVYPPYPEVYRALSLVSPDDVKCIIIGQDPYFHLGQADGLAFSVKDGVRFPPSLRNIVEELQTEFGYEIPYSGDLTPLAKRGVLLWNTFLTVEEGKPLSHKDFGWSTFTEHLLSKLNERNPSVVYLLWGNFAKDVFSKTRHEGIDFIECAHPSPLSANRGFFGSDCFKKVNEKLKAKGKEEIDFSLPSPLTLF